MGLYGPLTQDQPLGDNAVRVAFRDEIGNLALARGELRRPAASTIHRVDLGREPIARLARRRCADKFPAPVSDCRTVRARAPHSTEVRLRGSPRRRLAQASRLLEGARPRRSHRPARDTHGRPGCSEAPPIGRAIVVRPTRRRRVAVQCECHGAVGLHEGMIPDDGDRSSDKFAGFRSFVVGGIPFRIGACGIEDHRFVCRQRLTRSSRRG